MNGGKPENLFPLEMKDSELFPVKNGKLILSELILGPSHIDIAPIITSWLAELMHSFYMLPLFSYLLIADSSAAMIMSQALLAVHTSLLHILIWTSLLANNIHYDEKLED